MPANVPAPRQRTRGAVNQPLAKLPHRYRERFFHGRFPPTPQMIAAAESAHTGPPPPKGFAKIIWESDASGFRPAVAELINRVSFRLYPIQPGNHRAPFGLMNMIEQEP